VTALEAGADSYIQLPCKRSELTFNIWSLMRRTGKPKSASDSGPLNGGREA
jgi:DNA-binding response OmpR family regulator